MSNLLHRIRFAKKDLPPEGRVGILTFHVNPETGPYLVTASRSLVWIPQCSQDNTVNAAFRLDTSADQLFHEVVLAVVGAGREYDWGNIHPLSSEGIKAALQHVRLYELGEVEAITSMELDITLSDGTPVSKAPWVPQGTVVVVPRDREFVGGWGRVSRGDLVAVVHNPARGIAIATGGPSVVSGDRPK